jgi:hypothetical protein
MIDIDGQSEHHPCRDHKVKCNRCEKRETVKTQATIENGDVKKIAVASSGFDCPHPCHRNSLLRLFVCGV